MNKVYTIRIGSTPTFLYFDLYLYSAYAAHYVYFTCESIWPNSKASYFNPKKKTIAAGVK